MDLLDHAGFPVRLYRGVIDEQRLFASLVVKTAWTLADGALTLDAKQEWAILDGPKPTPEGVLPTDLWAHPRFTVLARHDDDLTGGAILHDAGTVVGLSNTWSADDAPVDPRDLLAIASATHPGRAVVDYARGADLEAMVGAGFEPLGPMHVWIRRR